MAMSLLIVDDHAAFRAFISQMLTAEGFDVAGEVPDGESAVAAVRDLHPDAVLLDIQLPGIDGFEVARRIAELERSPRVVLTSLRAASDYGRRITDSPVTGFLPKQHLSGATLAALLASPAPCN
jgi:DNA-binding NarL/FixJ family response regulator